MRLGYRGAGKTRASTTSKARTGDVFLVPYDRAGGRRCKLTPPYQVPEGRSRGIRYLAFVRHRRGGGGGGRSGSPSRRRPCDRFTGPLVAASISSVTIHLNRSERDVQCAFVAPACLKVTAPGFIMFIDRRLNVTKGDPCDHGDRYRIRTISPRHTSRHAPRPTYAPVKATYSLAAPTNVGPRLPAPMYTVPIAP